MAQILERPAHAGLPTAVPAVICALNGSPPGRATAAYAATLARGLGWRLGLVASGLRPLDPEMLADAVLEAEAGIVVQPSGEDGNAADAGQLATQSEIPVVVIPRLGVDARVCDGPVVAGASGSTPELAGIATRVALAIGAPLKVAHEGDDQRAERVLAMGRELAAGLVVLPADDAPRLSYPGLEQPVMFVPAGKMHI